MYSRAQKLPRVRGGSYTGPVYWDMWSVLVKPPMSRAIVVAGVFKLHRVLADILLFSATPYGMLLACSSQLCVI